MNGKALTIVLIILIVLLIGAIGTLGYLVYDSQQNNTSQKPEVTEVKETNNYFKYSIDDLVLNITNAKGRLKLFKLSFALKSNLENIEQIIENNKEDIVDSIIMLVSSRNSEELLSVGGKALLKEEMIEEISKIIEQNESQAGAIKKIYFKDFVIK